MNSDALHRRIQGMADASALGSLSNLRDGHPVCCVDGRKKEEIIGAPGGNTGLFVLMLATLEAFTQHLLSACEVEDILEAYLRDFGSFYMHTDTISVDQVRSRLKEASVGDEVVDGEGADAPWLIRPPNGLQEELLVNLIRPDAVGCGHLRMMLEHPDEYSVRVELVHDVIRSFYRRLWGGDDRLILDILEGVHVEEAVVRVHTSRSKEADEAVVLAMPSADEADVFVYHPEAAAFMQVENADFLSTAGLIDADQVGRFAEMQHELGIEQLQATIRHLAPDLPFCDVTFVVEAGFAENGTR